MASNRIAVVTGASRGIGRSIALRLAKSGHTIALIARTKEGLIAVRKEIEAAGGKAACFACDVTDRTGVDLAIGQIQSELGSPAVLVNNAGVGGPFHRADQVTDQDWDLLFATNVRSAFWFTRRFLVGMRDGGFGRIINIASVQGLTGAARSSTYVASKHALVGYTKAVAAEWAAAGITCNAICCGYIDTPMGIQTDQIEDHWQVVMRRIPANRTASPDEVAALVDFLAGNESGYITGAAIVMDGGLMADLGVS